MGPSDDREGRRAQLSLPDMFVTNALYAPDFWDRLMALYELDELSEICFCVFVDVANGRWTNIPQGSLLPNVAKL